ncbi:MAG: DUF664 domain-containing protein [Acidimicrobiia bacterium]|nr:DUF664 domain-containing protein [Acidimicrobiia bacterium]
MASDEELDLPKTNADERELLLGWLRYLRGAVQGKIEGLSDEQARWTPDGHLVSLLGIVNHLTCLEWRWIDGGFLGAKVSRTEAEFQPGSELTVREAVAAYRSRATETERTVRSIGLAEPSPPEGWAEGRDLRWVLLHLINETGRHAGHADATRELLDGALGE